ncbi:MAG: DUF1573 domain-containing protein [Armatimonadetes bacterium]|nr:DUF1573 domain-containing protein [Armatimonadota bacterium]
MHISLLLAVAFGQSIPVGPTPPLGTHGTYQQALLAVEAKMEKKDFAGAAQLLKVLPQRSVMITWDDSGIPQAKRAEFAAARDRAIADWKQFVPNLKISVGNSKDIKASFVDTLPPNPDSNGPAGAVFFDSSAPNDYRVEVVMARFRTNQKVESTGREIEQEMIHAIGRRLGLERFPRPGSAMFRLEGLYPTVFKPLGQVNTLADQVIKITEQLDKLIKAKKQIRVAQPKLVFEPAKYEGGSVLQGDQVPFSISISNQGASDLNYSVAPDCSCFSVTGAGKVEPGRTGLIRVNVNTTDQPGPFQKFIVLYTNDPERPSTVIPVTMNVEPAYQIQTSEARGVIIADDSGFKADVILVPNQKVKLKVTKVETLGVAAITEVSEWRGTLPNQKVESTGYKISLLGTKELPPGRLYGTLLISTDNPTWSVINHQFSVQKGIAAFPAAVYLGEVGTATSAVMILSRPGKPFEISEIKSTLPSVNATWKANEAKDEYRITVAYDGKLPSGPLNATLAIATDAAEQPEIMIDVTGIVK